MNTTIHQPKASSKVNSQSTPTAPTVDNAELLAELARLEAKNAALMAELEAKSKPRALSFKVSEKTGALSVYGFGRFPVTLYVEQWERLFAAIDEMKAFIKANRSQLTVKK
jgi:hypothetical protein